MRYLIRFNTKHEEDPKGRKWRILEDGVESLASKICINVISETIQEDVAPGVTKFHIMCHGQATWDHETDVATIS